MTKQEFRTIQERLKILINHTKKADLERGIDITSNEYKSALLILEDNLLEDFDLDRNQYEELKEEFKTKKKPTSYNDLEDVPVALNIDDVSSKAEEIAKKYIKAPVITHETRVIKETTVVKPQIFREIRTIEKVDWTGMDKMFNDINIVILTYIHIGLKI